MSALRLKLYVAGDTTRSHLAIANLRLLCAELQVQEPDCEVVDVLQDPDAAESARILTTPTLVRVHPTPPRRVTGDLSDHAAVLQGLSLPLDPMFPRSAV
ncbi:MAG TPA: circadian clock KaiB family protein [Longimicrobiaceae bacterium]|nr:circadian clock KaiB family protein [Longimicrobiaceae bacterium]